MDRCLIVIHIPKAAGVTLGTTIRLQYPTGILNFETLDKPLESFLDVAASDRKLAKVVMGHVHYGIHNYIPKTSTYVTILREPISRVLSLYKYILRVPRHPLHKRVLAGNIGLEEFIASGIDKEQTENGQTRQVCGLQNTDPDRSALEVAKRNLEAFAAVGLMESFDESLVLMRRALNWRLPPLYLRRNVSPPSQRSLTVSEQALLLIRERNELDLELYEFASQLFARRIQEHGPSFARELKTFRALNMFPNALGGKTERFVRRLMRSRVVRRLRRG